MASQVFYPSYESWDKSIDIDGTLSDTLLLERRDDGGSAIVKIIFDTFAARNLPPGGAFLRLYVAEHDAPQAADLCLSADYHHSRPISPDDWANGPDQTAVDGFPLSKLTKRIGWIDIPLTDASGIRNCPTGFRLFIEDNTSNALVPMTNSVTFSGFSGFRPELHLWWAKNPLNDGTPDDPSDPGDTGGGGGGDSGGSGDDGGGSTDKPPKTPTPNEHNHSEPQLPKANPEFALAAHRLAVTADRPVIEYRAKLREFSKYKGDT